MRVASLSPRERRVVKVGVTVVALALVVGRVVPAWIAWVGAERERAAHATERLDEAREAVRNLDSARDTLRARNERYLALAPVLVGGPSAASAGASLAVLVSGNAAAAGLELGTLRVTTDTARETVFARIAVRGDARGDIRGATAMLLALERGPVLLSVRQLSISQLDVGAPSDRAESLRLELVIEGLTIDRDAVQRLAVAARGVGIDSVRGAAR
jgi:hypothetical protein